MAVVWLWLLHLTGGCRALTVLWEGVLHPAVAIMFCCQCISGDGTAVQDRGACQGLRRNGRAALAQHTRGTHAVVIVRRSDERWSIGNFWVKFADLNQKACIWVVHITLNCSFNGLLASDPRGICCLVGKRSVPLTPRCQIHRTTMHKP